MESQPKNHEFRDNPKNFQHPPAQLLPFNRDKICLHQTEALCLLWEECGLLEELPRCHSIFSTKE